MRNLTDHIINPCNENITVQVMDDPGHGGACHHYAIVLPPVKAPDHAMKVIELKFQNGPIKECGTNGITHEVLLAILVDRLRLFQAGPYACRENAVALTKLEEATMWLQKRTRDRMARGVEGTHIK